MNERIRLLAEQANIHFSRVGILDGDPNGSARMVGYSKMEKFAELIVAECAQVCLAQRDPANLNYKPSVKFAEAINQHFGVEQ